MVILAGATKHPQERWVTKQVLTGGLVTHHVCVLKDLPSPIGHLGCKRLQSLCCLQDMLWLSVILWMEHISKPNSLREYTLLTSNIGAVITLRKQEGADQKMQWLLKEHKGGLHCNRLHSINTNNVSSGWTVTLKEILPHKHVLPCPNNSLIWCTFGKDDAKQSQNNVTVCCEGGVAEGRNVVQLGANTIHQRAGSIAHFTHGGHLLSDM